MSILQANIRTARERSDLEALQKLNNIDLKIRELIRQSLPPSLQLAQQLLETEDVDIATKMIEDNAELIDQEFLGTLLQAAQRLQESQQEEAAQRLNDYHRIALRTSMRTRMKSE